MSNTRLVSERERNVLRHGPGRPCACGCGELTSSGKHLWVRGHHFRVSPATSLQEGRAQVVAVRGGVISPDEFKAALTKVREAKGWRLVDVCEITGVSLNHLRTLLYGSRRPNVTREWARWFFGRLAGLAVEAPPGQQRRIDRELAASNRRVAAAQESLAHHIEHARAELG